MARQKPVERRAAALAAFEAAKQEIADLETRDAARIGKLAVKAGLADIDLDDATLLKELQAIAARFQKHTPTKPARSASKLTRPEAEDDRTKTE